MRGLVQHPTVARNELARVLGPLLGAGGGANNNVIYSSEACLASAMSTVVSSRLFILPSPLASHPCITIRWNSSMSFASGDCGAVINRQVVGATVGQVSLIRRGRIIDASPIVRRRVGAQVSASAGGESHRAAGATVMTEQSPRA